MLKISGNLIDRYILKNQSEQDKVKTEILDIMSSSRDVYDYDSEDELTFVLELRKNITRAATMLFRSGLSFKTFRKSVCNEKYWQRTPEGGFLLKEGVEPLKAVNDIYNNTSQYGTECATAIVIVYYKALIYSFPSELFNKLFMEIYLMDWQHVNNSLGVTYYTDPPSYLAGDCRYFKNPDVDPLKPEWQGENAIDLGDGYFYGHGVGIKTADEIITILNKKRKEGSNRSAYLMSSCTLPDFKYLYRQYEIYKHSNAV